MPELATRHRVVCGDRPALESVSLLPRQRLEIRMLGPFQVRRRDGSVVDPRRW